MERTTKEYGGGSGKEVFASELFRVVIWNMTHGFKTVISYGSHEEISFDGIHDDKFNSNEKCMNIFTFPEILTIIHHQENVGYEKGRTNAIKEIKSKFDAFKNCLET